MLNSNTILCSQLVRLISYHGVFVVSFQTMLKVLVCKNLGSQLRYMGIKCEHNGSKGARAHRPQTCKCIEWVIGQSQLSKMRDGVYVYAYSRAFPIEKNKRSKDFRSVCCAHRRYRSLVLVLCATQRLTTVNLGLYVWRSGEQAVSSRHCTLVIKLLI